VSDGKDGRAEPSVQTTDLAAQLLAQSLIEPRQWLVEQKNSRVKHQRSGKRHALALASGKLVYAAPLVAFKGNDSEHLRRALAPRGWVDAAHLRP
jgi:hypothetical protein